MARKQSSVIDDILALGMRLPWWISLLSASTLYLVLHHYSQISIPTATGPQDMSGPILSAVIKTGAAIGQYAIPGLLIVGMLGRLVKKGLRKLSYDRVASDKSGGKLDSLTWLQFERLIHQYFVERNFKVTETQEGPDGGVDLRLSKDGRTSTVQCKQWRTKKVGVAVVRERFGIMMAEQADQCFVVTCGKFTDEAKAWSADKTIELIDGDQLRYLLGHVNYDKLLFEKTASRVTSSSGCPRCGSKMVIRTAKRGPNSGSRFWGCSAYPRCRRTFDLS
jgi:restriction system protein